jgi:hypothetical protein
MRHDSTLRSDDEPSALDRRWREVHRHAESLRLPAVPTLVIAPHPDDETLLAGGLIATQRARDVDVHILAVTDGEEPTALPTSASRGSGDTSRSRHSRSSAWTALR